MSWKRLLVYCSLYLQVCKQLGFVMVIQPSHNKNARPEGGGGGVCVVGIGGWSSLIRKGLWGKNFCQTRKQTTQLLHIYIPGAARTACVPYMVSCFCDCCATALPDKRDLLWALLQENRKVSCPEWGLYFLVLSWLLNHLTVIDPKPFFSLNNYSNWFGDCNGDACISHNQQH